MLWSRCDGLYWGGGAQAARIAPSMRRGTHPPATQHVMLSARPGIARRGAASVHGHERGPGPRVRMRHAFRFHLGIILLLLFAHPKGPGLGRSRGAVRPSVWPSSGLCRGAGHACKSSAVPASPALRMILALYPERECRPFFWGPHPVIGFRDWASWPRQTLATAAPRRSFWNLHHGSRPCGVAPPSCSCSLALSRGPALPRVFLPLPPPPTPGSSPFALVF